MSIFSLFLDGHDSTCCCLKLSLIILFISEVLNKTNNKTKINNSNYHEMKNGSVSMSIKGWFFHSVYIIFQTEIIKELKLYLRVRLIQTTQTLIIIPT